jgi:hypothetical protein
MKTILHPKAAHFHIGAKTPILLSVSSVFDVMHASVQAHSCMCKHVHVFHVVAHKNSS